MTGLEPALLEADAAGLVGQLLRLARRRCLVVLFTDLTAATIERGCCRRSNRYSAATR